MKKIPVDIYNCEVLTFDSYTDLKRYCKRMDANIPESEFTYTDLGNIQHISGGMAGVLVYPEQPADLFFAVDTEQYTKDGEQDGDIYIDYPDLMNAVSHEALHMTWFILDNVGVGIDADNHESSTYLLGYLVKKYLELHKVFENGKKGK